MSDGKEGMGQIVGILGDRCCLLEALADVDVFDDGESYTLMDQFKSSISQ